jgi:hypothetical protein
MASWCDIHEGPCYRRDLVESWTARNPGHRVGWKKETLRVCTSCKSAKASQRTIVVAGTVGISPIESAKKRAAR